MSVEGTYRNHAARLRELVEALRAEEGYAEVRRRIRRYLSGEEVGADLAEEAEQQFRWIDRRRMDPEDRRRAAEVLEGAGAGFARMEGATRERLKKVVVRAIQDDDASLEEIENRVARALSSGRHQAYTVANTARAGFDRAGTFRSAEQIRSEAGEDTPEREEAEQLHFKFVGPPPERAFCKKHIGRVYTEAEIQRLSNGQGLPVRYYMGGYNCRHRWVLASDDEAERRMTDAELRPRTAALGSSGGSGGGSGGASGEGALSAAAKKREQRKDELRAKGYDRFEDAQTNERGFVAFHNTYRSVPELAYEEDLALFDAEEHGREVLMLQEGIGGKPSLDVTRDGIHAEYKRTADATNVVDNFAADVLSAIKKADAQQTSTDLVVYFQQDFDPDDVTRGAIQRLLKSHGAWRIRNITIRVGEAPDFREQTLSRKQLLDDGKRFQDF